MNGADEVFPVVIIGGGLAGLTAALHLADRGIQPLVLEADNAWPGGRLSGGEPDMFSYGGRTWAFPSHHGVHALWGGYDNMRATLNRYLTLSLYPSSGEEWIHRRGARVSAVEAGRAVRDSWLPAPFHYLQLLINPRFWGSITPVDFLSFPGYLVSLMWATGLDPLQEQIRLDGLFMEEFFRGWTPNLRSTLTGVAHSMLAAPSEAITLTGFLAAMRFYTMLRRDSWIPEYLPANTHDCLIQPMIDRIQAMGGRVLLGNRARVLTQLPEGDPQGGWQIRVEDARLRGHRTLTARQVILAVDPPAAQKLLLNSPDTAPIAEKMRFPPGLFTANIRMWFSRDARPGAPGGMFTGDFMLDNFFWLHRMQTDFKDWAATGGSALEVHLYSPRAAFMGRDERATLIEATAEVYRAFPELRGHFIHASLRWNSATHPTFIIPTADSLHVQTPFPDMAACGDWIGYPSPSLWMERASVTGIAAANQVLAAYGCPPFDIIPPKPPELSARLIGGGVRLGRATLGRAILTTARAARRRSA